LDFGAVDIGWNDDAGACVFEVNTAPGLENSALAAYVEAFNNYKENNNG
jgi:D-alanine-D-alanine ligase-like ATP-grasp enzyme